MNLFHTIILSIIEGFTEFLPISSTGHLILAGKLLQIPDTDFYKSFEIIIQLGAILAVLVLYWQKIFKEKYLWGKIFLAFLPSAFFGLIFYKFIKTFLLGNTTIVLMSLLVGGIFLIIIEKIYQEKKIPPSTLSNLKINNCLYIGMFQVLSLIPGVSRSAATIIGGLTVGLGRKEAVEFSFFLAIPTMFAASGYDIIKNYEVILNGNLKLLIVGFIGSFITALFAVKFFVGFVQKHSFLPFAVYRILLAVLLFLFLSFLPR